MRRMGAFAVPWSMRKARFAACAVVCALGACTRNETKGTANAPPAAEAGTATGATHPIARPADAVAELGVLTDRPREELTALIAPGSLVALLEARHCGPSAACDAVRAALKDTEHVKVTLENASDWGIPDMAALAFMAKGLSLKERAGLAKLPTVVVVHASGPASPAQLVARTGFALTAAIAEKTKGYVYDETVRRIEGEGAFAVHAIVTPLGEAAFREDRIAIQYYVQDDGTSRLISLGMRRFGAPDLEVRGASAAGGRALGELMNAVAARVAGGATDSPLPLTVDDPRAKGKSAPVDLVVPPHQQGDSDNTIVPIVPEGGATPDGYDRLSSLFFGKGEELIDQRDDPALAAARDRAARAFPAVLARWQKMPAPRPQLLVK